MKNRLAATVCLLVFPTLGHASGAPETWRVEPLPLRIFAGGDVQLGVERVIRPGDEIMRTTIGIPAASELLSSIQLEIAGERWTAPSGIHLAGVRVTGGSAGAGADAQRTFCSSEIRSSSGRERVRSKIRFCVTDKDRDGILDHGFLVGARRPEDATLRSIAPTPYRYLENIPLPNSHLRVTFYKPPAMAFDFNGHTLQVRPTILGEEWNIEILHTRVDGARKSFKSYRTVGGNIYPRILEFGAAKISILAFDKETSEVRLRVDHGFEAADFEGAYGGMRFF